MRNGDNLLLNDGGNDCNINCEMEGSVASLRVKLKNNEELERVKRIFLGLIIRYPLRYFSVMGTNLFPKS